MRYYSVTQILNPFNNFANVPPDRLAYAAARGSLIHSTCAAYANGLFVLPLPEDHQPYFDSFKNWFDKYVKRVIAVEKEYKDDKLLFIGHIDLICELTSDEIVVIDYKTPILESRTWRGQIAAYCHLAKIKSGIALKLNPKGQEAKAICYRNQHRDFAAFLSALNAYRYFKL